MPASQVVAVVAGAGTGAGRLRRAGEPAERDEVPGRPWRRTGRARVVVIAGGGATDRLDLAPARIVDGLEGAQLTAFVLEVAHGQDGIVAAGEQQVGGVCLMAPIRGSGDARRTRDIPRGGHHRVTS